MNHKEAYKRICDEWNEKPTVMSCWEYADFYGFYLAPPDTKVSDKAFVGLMTLVMKDTGEVISEDERPDLRVRRLERRKVAFQ